MFDTLGSQGMPGMIVSLVRDLWRGCGSFVPIALCRTKADLGPLGSDVRTNIMSIVDRLRHAPFKEKRCRAAALCAFWCLRKSVGRDVAGYVAKCVWALRDCEEWGSDSANVAPVEFFETSTKSFVNLEEPFLFLARSFTKRPDLRFCSNVVVSNLRDIEPTPDVLRQWEVELALANSIDLPPDDDDWDL